jgi:hypothetical protein
LSLETLEIVPKKIIGKGKDLREGTSVDEIAISDDSHYPHIGTPIFSSHSISIPSAGVSQILNFGSVPIEFSPHVLGLEGEILVTSLSPKFVPWFRPNTS